MIALSNGVQRKCLVIDYQTHNKVTGKFIWSMPKVDDIFSELNSAKDFSTLDLQAGYQHIPLDEASIPKKDFTCHLGSMNKSK